VALVDYLLSSSCFRRHSCDWV